MPGMGLAIALLIAAMTGIIGGILVILILPFAIRIPLAIMPLPRWLRSIIQRMAWMPYLMLRRLFARGVSTARGWQPSATKMLFRVEVADTLTTVQVVAGDAARAVRAVAPGEAVEVLGWPSKTHFRAVKIVNRTANKTTYSIYIRDFIVTVALLILLTIVAAAGF